MEIEFRGKPTKEMYFKAIRWIYKPTKKSTIIRVSVFIGFTILYLVLVVAAFQQEGTSSYEISRLIRHLFTVLLLAYILFQPAITAYRKANSFWSDPAIRRVRSGKVSPIGVIQDSQTEWMTWDTFSRVNNNPDFIALLTIAGKFVFLQRSFFKDDQDWKLVQTTVDSKTQPVTE